MRQEFDPPRCRSAQIGTADLDAFRRDEALGKGGIAAADLPRPATILAPPYRCARSRDRMAPLRIISLISNSMAWMP